MFPIWHNIQLSYRETENTEFHATDETVIQNSFRVCCHNLRQPLNMFSIPSSTCSLKKRTFFYTKQHFERKGTWFAAECKWCFSTHVFDYSVLASFDRMGAFKI